MAKAITESAPVGKDQSKVVNIIISVVSIMRFCNFARITYSHCVLPFIHSFSLCKIRNYNNA